MADSIFDAPPSPQVFSRGTAMLGTREFMRLGKINDKITVSGVDVRADDIVLADENGAVVVQERRLEDVIESCEYGAKHDKMVLEAVKSGMTMKVALRHAKTVLGPPVERIGPHRP